MRSADAGLLMPIGGAEDKTGPRSVLTRFVDLAGGAAARIVVVSTASSFGPLVTGSYLRLFTELGAGLVTGIGPTTRSEADGPAVVDAVTDATAIFMTGGNQLKLSTVLGGTALGTAIVAAHARGAVIAGTSAGASALSTHMVAFGGPGATPKARMSQLSAGLGLLPGAIVDQHFTQRNRIGRLMSLVATSPQLLGIGVDEDTGAIIAADGICEVVGRGAVTVVDGRALRSNATVVRRGAPLLVSGAVLHILPAGARFDLHTMTLLTCPGADEASTGPAVTTLERIP